MTRYIVNHILQPLLDLPTFGIKKIGAPFWKFHKKITLV